MKKIIGIVFIIAGLAIGYFCIPSMSKDSPAEILENLKSGNEEAITEELSTIAEASVLEYDYTNAASWNENEQFLKKVNIPFTSNVLVMMYDGKIKIGADVSQLGVEVTKNGEGDVQKVEVSVPDVQITSHEIDRDSIEFPVEKSSPLNKLKNKEIDELEETARSEMEENVEKNGTMDEAEKELKKSITGYLQGLYGENVEVNFKKVE